jgi:hypothetical protein
MIRRQETYDTNGDGWAPLEHVITKELFKAEVYAWAKRIGVEVKALHLRRMTRK